MTIYFDESDEDLSLYSYGPIRSLYDWLEFAQAAESSPVSGDGFYFWRYWLPIRSVGRLRACSDKEDCMALNEFA